MAEKCNLYELQKEIPYETVSPILTAWSDLSDNDVTDLARMAYEAGRNSISKEKNKMEQVAAMLKIKINEQFIVTFPDRYYTKAKLTKNGAWEVIHGKWSLSDRLLRELLTNKAVIVDED